MGIVMCEMNCFKRKVMGDDACILCLRKFIK